MSIRSERIKALIEESGKSYQELERITGIKKSSLQRYASGVTAKIPLDVIEKLSTTFNVSQKYLLGYDVPKRSRLTIGNMINKTIAHNIQLHREEANLSQRQFADILGVDESFAVGLESGENALEREMLYKICDALHLIPSNFLSRDEEFSEDEEYLLSRRENAPAPKGERLIDDKNLLRIAGRDGSYIVKVLTDEQMKAFITMVDHLPDAYEDL